MSASAWQGLVSAQVNRNTRYPPSAQGASGASSVSFSIDRSGRLVSASLSRSSGSSALDAEAVAIVRRASPFPPPPPEIPGGRFNFTKTINFRH
jgi:protein TonB